VTAVGGTSGASEEKSTLLSAEVIDENCAVSRLITDIVRKRERLPFEGKSGWVCMQNAWGK